MNPQGDFDHKTQAESLMLEEDGGLADSDEDGDPATPTNLPLEMKKYMNWETTQEDAFIELNAIIQQRREFALAELGRSLPLPRHPFNAPQGVGEPMLYNKMRGDFLDGMEFFVALGERFGLDPIDKAGPVRGGDNRARSLAIPVAGPSIQRTVDKEKGKMTTADDGHCTWEARIVLTPTAQ
ncbi:hypothetical protein EST38_g11405 [Candolleomyces aberdarensis]|uniref:Uncharacterized protein n=1 Tax=Candolleomyces aberdarensis TaxID=2316362 RepID=A0A4Q2D5L3_9AGAR|nr:hypothetical protein EST38_g11405 [Candolleomyces aberdarensis]